MFRGQPNMVYLLEPGLREIYHAETASMEENLKRTQLFTALSSQRAYEQHMAMGALPSDPDLFDYKKHGAMQYAGFDAGYVKTFDHLSRGFGVSIERELVDDNMYPGAGIPGPADQAVRGHAEAVEYFREKVAAEVYINAFTDSGTTRSGSPIAGADAVGLCSLVHPLSPSNTGSTQANEGTLSLSIDNIDTTRQAMRAWTNDQGDILTVNPNELLVPPELEADALRIANSQNEPGHANNDANVVGARVGNVICWDQLTDANAWWLQDSARRGRYLVWYDREMPQFMADLNQNAMQYNYLVWLRQSRGWTSPLFCYGQNPS